MTLPARRRSPASAEVEFEGIELVATYKAISAVSKAILGLLQDARGTFEPAIPADAFKLFHASDFDAPAGGERGLPDGFGVSLCLYRVNINSSMRNAPRKVAPDGNAYGPPLPLDLYYVLTAWAKDPERQQRLFGWAMRVVHDVPCLPATLINHHSPDLPEPAFRANETVELTLDPLSFQDMTTLWDKLKPKMQTSTTYVARMILIESTQQRIEAGPVQTRAFRSITAGGTP